MRRILAVALIALAGVCACSSSAAGPETTATPAAAHAAAGKYLGYAGPVGTMPAFAAATGATPDMASEYLSPGDPFTAPPAGVTPFVSLSVVMPPSRVLAGADDSAIDALGRQLAAYGRPAMVSVDPEGNGPWYPYGTRDAAAGQYIAEYRYVRARLIAAGARKVTWVWTISNSPSITHPSLLRSLYPGNGVVDVVGVDGYFIGSENSWQQVFGRVFGEVRAFSPKPFLIAETSVQAGPNAAGWVRELFTGAESTPGVLGLIWFNYDKAAEERDDWRLQDDPAALAAFRTAVKGATGS